MGLPQEVVDRIMDMLQDDRRALEACSLTCKTMFASTRHLIHKTLHVTKKNNQRILTSKEKKKHARGDYLLALRLLSFMGEHDLLKYTRHLNISIGYFAFSPNILEPHLRHFKSLDRVNTLTIYSYDGVLWRDVYNTYFTQFYPTLTTLALRYPTSHYRFVLQFALQFPNLENFTLEGLRHETGDCPGDISASHSYPASPAEWALSVRFSLLEGPRMGKRVSLWSAAWDKLPLGRVPGCSLGTLSAYIGWMCEFSGGIHCTHRWRR